MHAFVLPQQEKAVTEIIRVMSSWINHVLHVHCKIIHLSSPWTNLDLHVHT